MRPAFHEIFLWATEVNTMEKEMEEKIKNQLEYSENRLYCFHNSENACDECMKTIRGDVSGLRGDVSGLRGDVSGLTGNVSGLTGDVSGIEGKTTEIIELLKAHKKT